MNILADLMETLCPSYLIIILIAEHEPISSWRKASSGCQEGTKHVSLRTKSEERTDFSP
jgi:hypothetical protein